MPPRSPYQSTSLVTVQNFPSSSIHSHFHNSLSTSRHPLRLPSKCLDLATWLLFDLTKWIKRNWWFRCLPPWCHWQVRISGSRWSVCVPLKLVVYRTSETGNCESRQTGGCSKKSALSLMLLVVEAFLCTKGEERFPVVNEAFVHSYGWSSEQQIVDHKRRRWKDFLLSMQKQQRKWILWISALLKLPNVNRMRFGVVVSCTYAFKSQW